MTGSFGFHPIVAFISIHTNGIHTHSSHTYRVLSVRKHYSASFWFKQHVHSPYYMAFVDGHHTLTAKSFPVWIAVSSTGRVQSRWEKWRWYPLILYCFGYVCCDYSFTWCGDMKRQKNSASTESPKTWCAKNKNNYQQLCTCKSMHAVPVLIGPIMWASNNEPKPWVCTQVSTSYRMNELWTFEPRSYTRTAVQDSEPVDDTTDDLLLLARCSESPRYYCTSMTFFTMLIEADRFRRPCVGGSFSIRTTAFSSPHATRI